MSNNDIIGRLYKPYVSDFLSEVRTVIELADGKIENLEYIKPYWSALELSIQEKYPQWVKDGILYAAIREWLVQKGPQDIIVLNDKLEITGVNYENIKKYIVWKYAPIYFKRTCYIYVDGFYVENANVLQNEIKRIIEEEWDDVNKRRINGVVEEVMKRIEWERTISGNEYPFNWTKGSLIPFVNGVYWVDYDVLLPHSPYWLFSYKIPWEFNRDATCPHIEQFFSEIVEPEDVPLLYEFPALAIMQEPGYARAYMLVGSGSNGKSTYLNLIIKLLGEENVAKVSLQDINTKRFAPAELVGKLANIFPDLPTHSLTSTSIFKALTGNDAIYVEKKFKDPFSFRFSGRLAFSTNQPPQVDDDSFAFWRRWALIEFPNKFSENPDLLQQLIPEIPGLINKIIDHIKKIKREGLTKTKRIEEIMNKWRSMSDSVYFFIQKRVVPSPNSEVAKDEVYNEYVAFCEENDIKPVIKNIFGMKIQQFLKVETVQRRVGGRRKRFYRGIKLIRDEDVDEHGTAQLMLNMIK